LALGRSVEERHFTRNQLAINRALPAQAGSASLIERKIVMNEIIYAYTRTQALADGYQVDVSSVAAEAGIRFPVYLTRTVFDAYVTVPPEVTGQDEAGRLWDIVWMLRFAIGKAKQGQDRLPVALYVRNNNDRPKLVKLIAVCSARDMDDPQPAITVMMPDED
jgi:Family of unknown function (DUF6573)